MAFIGSPLMFRTGSVQSFTSSSGRCKSPGNRLPSLRPNRTLLMSNTSISTPKNQKYAMLLVDHGSKRKAANELLDEIRDRVRESMAEGIPVHSAHMEIASPSIHDGITLCVAGGAQHVIVVPFFLSPGRHVSSDIPNLVAKAAETFPGLTYEVRSHLGSHPALINVILELGKVENEVMAQ